MSETVLGQCATLIGRAAIPQKLLAVPVPAEEDAGKILTAGSDGSIEWCKNQLPDDELLLCFIETDTLPAVTDGDGSILTDETGKILMM